MSGTVTRSRLRDFLRDDGGATAIEYALIASGIAGAIIAVVMALGHVCNRHVHERFQRLQLTAGRLPDNKRKSERARACRGARLAV